MSDIYYTIQKSGEGVYTEKRSKFLAFARFVDNVEKAKEIVKEYQNEYHDARHVCWAYMIGPDCQTWQINDNGEPSGTAGKPILGQINRLNLTNVIVVVVRYFGGIKLGTSGLISAYREATSLALDDAGVKEEHKKVSVSVTFPYSASNDVMKLVKCSDVEVVDKQFDNSCSMRLNLREDIADGFIQRLLDIDGVTRCD